MSARPSKRKAVGLVDGCGSGSNRENSELTGDNNNNGVNDDIKDENISDIGDYETDTNGSLPKRPKLGVVEPGSLPQILSESYNDGLLPPRVAMVTSAANSSPSQIGDRGTLDDVCFTERSLHNWPEFSSPSREPFDREKKMREIAARPTRKQFFGKPASYSRIGVKPILNPPPAPNSLELDHPSTAENEIDWFGLPDRSMAVIHNGELAFRDATFDESGHLLPTTEIYQPTCSRGGTQR